MSYDANESEWVDSNKLSIPTIDYSSRLVVNHTGMLLSTGVVCEGKITARARVL